MRMSSSARPLVLGMQIDRDAPTVVLHGHRVTGLVQRQREHVGVAVEVLVNGIVHDFPDEVVQPLGVHGADVHRRPAAHRLQAFENRDVFGGIAGSGNCAHP